MGTRSSVIIRVKPEDIGKTIKFDRKKLPVPLSSWNTEKVRSKCKPVTLEKNYVGVYCHWDGYPSGVGAALKVFADTYERALNLVLGGSISSIGEDDFTHYANRNGEVWTHIEPIQGDTAIDVNAEVDEDYAYLFDEDNGGWKILNRETNEFEDY
jgi:hypothetical protein